VCSSFFRFGGGRPLHSVQFLICCNLLEVSTTCFGIFSLRISYMSFLRVPPLPRSARFPGLHPSMPFMVGSFIPVMHCGPFRHLFSNVPPFGLLHVYRDIFLLRLCHAQRVTFFPAAVTFRSPQFAWVQDFLKMFLLRHATVAGRDSFLQAAASFFRDPQSPRVSSFGSPRRPAACFRPLCRFFRRSTGFATASSLGTS
jgi:hypothetical protein